MTILSADNISFSYGKMPVLRDISLAVQAGEWIGLLGPNGSGKTTLIKCFASILKLQSGKIELFNKPCQNYPRHDFAKLVATVPQDTNITFPFSAFEVVLMGRSPHKGLFGFDSAIDIEISKKAMEITDTAQFIKRQFWELSGGERQRVIIARALAQEPKILLLDEPTTFLDIRHQQDILKLLKKLVESESLTIISAMHDINLALLYCKRIALLKNGRLAKCGPANETVTYSNLKTVFDTEVYVGINDLNGKPYYLPYA
ncbi:MAG: ABC transporter ATP-binding protein [Deltaproteobacteria bacterium]|nr:ABC transporter ATP-binding protein [Deltaproteobacteria bacterium]MBI2974802.1 ABC transporter ATP-binding protein [Deltaproteobacteria bacterium]